LEQLQEIREFCDNETECRRQQILRHFGEQFDRQHCRKRCDVCAKDEVTVEQDFTDAAKNLLQIVSGLTKDGDTLSKTMLVDVFRGSKKKEVISKDFHNNPLFGAGKCYNKDLVTRIIDQLVKQGCLDWSFVRGGAWSVKYIIVSSGAAESFVLATSANTVVDGARCGELQETEAVAGPAGESCGVAKSCPSEECGAH
jgi:bloom syndrome protein